VRAANRERGRARGVSALEMLLALALSSVGLATLAMLSRGVLAAFDADPASAEQQQRGRAAMAALVEDIARAGSGFVGGADGIPGVALPAVLPDRPRSGAWVVAARPATIATVAAARSAAQARLAIAAAAGEGQLVLERPAYCSPLSPACRFAAGDDVLLADAHGRFALAAVRAVAPPLVLVLEAPVSAAWPAGTLVATVDARTYAARDDAATGLLQLVRAVGTGPATAMIDFVQRFDVTWRIDGPVPVVRLAPDGREEHATAGPVPPLAGETGDPAWPPGENCVFFRDADGSPRSRLVALGTAPTAVDLTGLADGPWCPSAAAATRWDADLVRVADVSVTVDVAVASALLRPPTAALLAPPAGTGLRVVPTLTLRAVVSPGRRGARP
jgi:hypothetical protein